MTPPERRRRIVDGERTQRFVIEAARLLNDRHCENVLALDVRSLCDVTDFVVIASGTSDRQIASVGDEMEQAAAAAGMERFGRQADTPTTWLVLDFIDAVVHLFDPATRAHYDLEMLWGDAPRVAWRADHDSREAEEADTNGDRT